MDKLSKDVGDLVCSDQLGADVAGKGSERTTDNRAVEGGSNELRG